MSKISRRKFLKTAGAATLAVAAAGVLAGCSEEDVPIIPGVNDREVIILYNLASKQEDGAYVLDGQKVSTVTVSDSMDYVDITRSMIPDGYYLEALENSGEDYIRVKYKEDEDGNYVINLVVYKIEEPEETEEVDGTLWYYVPGEQANVSYKFTVTKGAASVTAGKLKSQLPEGTILGEGISDSDVYYISGGALDRPVMVRKG